MNKGNNIEEAVDYIEQSSLYNKDIFAQEALHHIKQALYKLDTYEHSTIPSLQNELEKEYKHIKELEKSDTSKEQSSIDYYNEMRKYKAQINAIREIVEQGSKTHHSYAIKNLLNEVLDNE